MFVFNDFDLMTLSEEQRAALIELQDARIDLNEVQAALFRRKKEAFHNASGSAIQECMDYEKLTVDPIKERIKEIHTRLITAAVDKERLNSFATELSGFARMQVMGIMMGAVTGAVDRKNLMSASGIQSVLTDSLKSAAPMIATFVSQSVNLPLLLEISESETVPKAFVLEQLEKLLSGSLMR